MKISEYDGPIVVTTYFVGDTFSDTIRREVKPLATADRSSGRLSGLFWRLSGEEVVLVTYESGTACWAKGLTLQADGKWSEREGGTREAITTPKGEELTP